MQWWCDRSLQEFEATEKVARAVLGDDAAIYTEA